MTFGSPSSCTPFRNRPAILGQIQFRNVLNEECHPNTTPSGYRTGAAKDNSLKTLSRPPGQQDDLSSISTVSSISSTPRYGGIPEGLSAGTQRFVVIFLMGYQAGTIRRCIPDTHRPAPPTQGSSRTWSRHHEHGGWCRTLQKQRCMGILAACDSRGRGAALRRYQKGKQPI